MARPLPISKIRICVPDSVIDIDFVCVRMKLVTFDDTCCCSGWLISKSGLRLMMSMTTRPDMLGKRRLWPPHNGIASMGFVSQRFYDCRAVLKSFRKNLASMLI